MSDHGSDDERIAAFLDGRMDASRREEMLAHLSRDDEDREVLARAADILRELEEEERAEALGQPSVPVPDPETASTEAAEGVIPLQTRRARPARPRVARWVALAAVLAGVALFSTREPSLAGEPVRLAARLEQGGRGLPARWAERRPWTLSRGEGQGGGVAARSVRAGAMLVDLAVAVRARDAEATRVLARQIEERFEPLGTWSNPLRVIADSAGGSPERLESLVGQATERIASRPNADGDALRLGAWTEAASLAAASRDAAFFRDGPTRRMLDRAGRVTGADPAARKALETVRLLLADDPPQWEALAPALDALLRELASE